MSDQNEQRPGGVRRVGSKDRKAKLDSGGPLFPPEPTPPPEDHRRFMPPPAETPAPVELPYRDPTPPAAEAERFPPLDPQKLVKPQRRKAQRSDEITPPKNTGWANLMTVLFLLATVGVIAAGIVIYQDPYTPINVFAPPTPQPIIITATFPPAPTPTISPTATFTPLPAAALTAIAPEATVESGEG
jgi:hypothetical protein